MRLAGWRWLRSRLTASDRGVAAVYVTLLLGSGVLLGMGALVVDIGNLYAEREQLRSGADAAALKVAQACAAAGPAGCADSAAGLAARYADANAADNASDVPVICGRGGGFGDCPPPTGTMADCVRAAPEAGNYVEVHTSTRLPDGTTALPPAFAQAVMNGYRGATVTACARARWGTPSAARSSLAISACEWNRYTKKGAVYPDPPAEQVIDVRDGDEDAAACEGGGPPNGFAWLADRSGGCRTPVAAGGTYPAEPRSGLPAACEAVLTGARNSGRPLLTPVYSAVAGEGRRARYTIVGFAAFVVTGWDLPDRSRAPSKLTGRSSCKDADACIYGYFTRATLPGGGPTGGPDLGARIVGLVG
jgi:Flp pilus assembly protein TadG